MAIGMTYEEFWYGDPWKIKIFKKAHELKNEIVNQQMWLQGLYIYDAVSAVVSSALGKKQKYTERPIELRPKTDAKEAREKAVKAFEAMRIAWSQKGNADG